MASLAWLSGCEAEAGLDPVAPDAGVVVPPADAGADGSVRRMVERTLFGQMPLDNRLHDPNFAQIDGNGWAPFDYTTGDVYKVAQVHLPATPLDQPALRVDKESQYDVAAVLGEAKGAAGAIEVSIWLGRPVGQDPVQDVTVSLLGFFLDDDSGALDLALDAGTKARTLSDIRWQRVSATAPDGPVAFTYLRVVTTLDGPLYLSSPILVAAGNHQVARSINQVERRPLTLAEKRAVRGAEAQKRDRFHSAKREQEIQLRRTRR